MASFSFSFSGDDIEDDSTTSTVPGPGVQAQDATVTPTPAASAFPVQGKPQLLPQRHDLKEMLSKLPSKIAYSLLDVALDSLVDADGTKGSSSTVPRETPFRIRLPRRELWDVKVQLMAEEDEEDGGSNTNGGGELAPGLGTHDVKTGIYEGGFKSWESSVDLVKVLLQQPPTTADSSSAPTPSDVASAVLLKDGPVHIIERSHPLSITVADYNPSVLYLVTLPNFVLAWALQQRHASPLLQQALIIDEDGDDDNGELELTDEVKDAFCTYVASAGITLSFLSGGWSAEFVDLLYDTTAAEKPAPHTLVLGAETIYSPFALETFAVTLLSILRRDGGPVSAPATAKAIIGAKKLYFGVGGSLDDFVKRMREAGATVNELREEADGVRRGVVQCVL
ncbi:hypothetical protein SPBR_08471 [Sporothrix brasiliensis 5110]|uniref:Uncharacterized protein n=1 Tax=Sporothrix brasiliensis 5110 TaxID=1398154 RepID=A0A0C2F6S0_9PEZI|nr:uncharacterized protein SPBR_08471 [Sporothrix brasiliensis 5110]KIH86703.1 hypothetical protein SPBR_08471 [Sporothrix brasiliensis 5110]